jgi:putative transposase
MAEAEPTRPHRKLYHAIPAWVKPGASFHIRIRIAREFGGGLINPSIGSALLQATASYHSQQIWFCHVLLLMPDHLHGIAAFPANRQMSEVVRSFKRAAARNQHVLWQEGYFDHRIRNGKELDEKLAYILQNPVAKGLCATTADWPWVFRPSEYAEGESPA